MCIEGSKCTGGTAIEYIALPQKVVHAPVQFRIKSLIQPYYVSPLQDTNGSLGWLCIPWNFHNIRNNRIPIMRKGINAKLCRNLLVKYHRKSIEVENCGNWLLYSCSPFRVSSNQHYISKWRNVLLLQHLFERVTRIELATPSLGSWCSTNWAIPAYMLFY